MSDLSTREQIRAEAVEVLARWQHDLDYAKYPELDKRPWGELNEAQRESYRAAVSGYVDALGDLLPTEIRCAAVSRDYEDLENLDHEVITTRDATAWPLLSGRDGRRGRR